MASTPWAPFACTNLAAPSATHSTLCTCTSGASSDGHQEASSRSIRRNQAQSGAIKRHHRGQSGATQPTLCTTFSPSSAIERQPSPIRRNQAQSGAIRRNQAQSGAPSSAEAAPPRPRHRAAPRRAYRPRRSHPRASHGSAATRTLRAPRASPAARAQSSAIERDRTAAERNRTRSNVIRCRRAQSNVF